MLTTIQPTTNQIWLLHVFIILYNSWHSYLEIKKMYSTSVVCAFRPSLTIRSITKWTFLLNPPLSPFTSPMIRVDENYICIPLKKSMKEFIAGWSSIILTYTSQSISNPLESFLTSGYTFITAYGINAFLRSLASRHTHTTFIHIWYCKINNLIRVLSLWACQFYCMHQIRTDTTSEPNTMWKNIEFI